MPMARQAISFRRQRRQDTIRGTAVRHCAKPDIDRRHSPAERAGYGYL